MTLQTFSYLQRLTRDLEAIVEWRDELQSRIHRAQLRFELCGLDADEQEALAAEVSAFLQVCRALSESVGSSRPTWGSRAA